MQPGFHRLAILPVEDVLPLILKAETPGQRAMLLGNSVSIASTRLRCFALKGTACSCCGLQAKYFALEKAPNQVPFHLNLYSIDKDGAEVLMTRDHVHPQALGGHNGIKNSQTMCFPCNQRKGCSTPVESIQCSSSAG
jgi:hypothetical protein